MAKRPNPRSIKTARCYTIPEVSEALDVSIGTVRGWVKVGLPAMTGQRPYLILGDALRGFLEDRRGRGRATLGLDQLFCLTCKLPQSPMGMMVDCVPQTGKTARLVGLCGVCSCTCNRIVSRAKIPDLVQIFDVEFREGRKA